MDDDNCGLDDEDEPPLHENDSARHNHFTGLALDPISGRVWLTTRHNLLSFNRDGGALTPAVFPNDLKKPQALAYDHASQSLWFGTKKEVVHISTQGAVLARLPTDDGFKALGVAPLGIVPQISLLTPADGVITK